MNNEKKYRQYGYRLAEARTRAGLMQKEVAKHLGVKDNIISYFENGDRLPSVEQYKELSKLFNVSTDYLLGISEYPNQENANIGEITGLDDNAIEWLKQNNSHPDNYLLAINLLFKLESFQWFCSSLTGLYVSVQMQEIFNKFGEFVEKNPRNDEREKKAQDFRIELARYGYYPMEIEKFYNMEKYRLIQEFDKMVNEIIDYCNEIKIEITQMGELNGNDN